MIIIHVNRIYCCRNTAAASLIRIEAYRELFCRPVGIQGSVPGDAHCIVSNNCCSGFFCSIPSGKIITDSGCGRQGSVGTSVCHFLRSCRRASSICIKAYRIALCRPYRIQMQYSVLRNYQVLYLRLVRIFYLCCCVCECPALKGVAGSGVLIFV